MNFLLGALHDDSGVVAFSGGRFACDLRGGFRELRRVNRAPFVWAIQN
jgi:hypothetical protein